MSLVPARQPDSSAIFRGQLKQRRMGFISQYHPCDTHSGCKCGVLHSHHLYLWSVCASVHSVPLNSPSLWVYVNNIPCYCGLCAHYQCSAVANRIPNLYKPLAGLLVHKIVQNMVHCFGNPSRQSRCNWITKIIGRANLIRSEFAEYERRRGQTQAPVVPILYDGRENVVML